MIKHRMLVPVAALSLFLAVYSYTALAEAAGPFYKFHLGKQSLNGVELDFQFPGNGQNLYLFSFSKNILSAAPKEKAVIIIGLYDPQKKLLAEASSVCVRRGEPIGSVAFNMSEVSKTNIQTVDSFTLSMAYCPGEAAAQPLDEARPEVKFAKQIQEAVFQGKVTFLSLLDKQPQDEKEKKEEEQFYNIFHYLLTNGGRFVGVRAPTVKEVKAQKIPPTAFVAEYKSVTKSQEAGGNSTMEMGVSFPIGQVNGSWKILSFSTM